jgi:UDP-glucuronate decarboxylase
VDDLVDGLIRLMNAEGVHEPVNLGNPHEFTIRELAELITELCGTPSSVRYCPLPEDDPVHRQPDITRAKQLLNWTPKLELREGLERTIADFEGRLTSPDAQCSRVRAALRRAMEHRNGKARPGPMVEHRHGTPVTPDVGHSGRGSARAESAPSDGELVAEFEGLWTR